MADPDEMQTRSPARGRAGCPRTGPGEDDGNNVVIARADPTHATTATDLQKLLATLDEPGWQVTRVHDPSDDEPAFYVERVRETLGDLRAREFSRRTDIRQLHWSDIRRQIEQEGGR